MSLKFIFRKSVSVDLNMNFINAAELDDDLFIKCTVNKVGKNIAFS